MKKVLLLILGLAVVSHLNAQQNKSDEEGVRAACTDYIDGFYEGDESIFLHFF